MSSVSRAAIAKALSPHYAAVRTTAIDDIKDLNDLVERRPDLVILGMKFLPSHPELGLHDPDKIWISEYLNQHNIAYTGSDKSAHRLELDKSLAKRQMLAAGLRTSPFHVIEKGKPIRKNEVNLSYPAFIKPTSLGGGAGIDSGSLVHTYDQLITRVAKLADRLNADSLVEEYLPGREFSVAILRLANSDTFYVMPIELIAQADEQGTRILSKQVKLSNQEEVRMLTDEVLHEKVTDLALDAFHALGARDYGRIDIRLDERGVPHFLEANLIPSLIDGYGSFPKACELNEGFSYEQMLHQIIDLALERRASRIADHLPVADVNGSGVVLSEANATA